MSNLDPKALLASSHQGDKLSYHELLKWLMDHCQKQLRWGLKSYFNFPTQAYDDITQEVLLTFHRSHQTFDLTRPLVPWVNALIKHKMIDFIRRKDFAITMTAADIHLLTERWELEEESSLLTYEELQQLIDQLNPKQKELIQLAKLEELSINEIAQKLSLSESNVKVSIHRAMKELKVIVDAYKRNTIDPT